MVPAVFLHSLTISVWNTAVQKVKNCKARIIPPSRFWPDSGAYQYRSPPTKAALLREPYDLTQIVRNESVRFQDFALCAKCLCAALAASQRGCIRFGNGFIPPSRFWPDSGAYQYRSPPTKAALLREPYDLTQIVRNESVRFQDFALCAKCLCAALAASQRGCIRFGNGFIPPSRS